MLRLERSRAAGKDFLGTGLGTQPSDHWVPDHRKKSGEGASRSQETKGTGSISLPSVSRGSPS